MDLRDYVRLLRRRWRLLTVCTLIGLLVAAGVTLSKTPTYTATTTLFVAAQSAATEDRDVGTAYTGGLFVQQRVKSYADILTTPRVADLVVRDLRLPLSAGQVARRITASAPLDTVLLDVSVVDASPVQAQAIANSLGRQFAALVDELETPPGAANAPVKVSVVQPAQLATSPTAPRPRLYLGIGLLLGLAVGTCTAVLRETLDTSVGSPEQAQDLVGAPVLGAISFDADASKNPLIVQVDPMSPRAEAFRQIRTNLQFVDVDHQLRSVVLTSSIPSEGKSTTACNVAISLAQAGVKVVLVEGDLRRPRVAQYMGLEGAIGLTSVLLGRVELQDALQAWGEGTVQVLASGPLPPNPSELLGSAGMEQLLRRLEGLADVVIIDAPPILPVTDAAILGAMTSGVLMLIGAGRTSREQVARAAETLRAARVTILGAVLNMVPTRGPDAYAYGYGYGYGGDYASRSAVGRLDSTESALGRGGAGTLLGSSAWTRLRDRAHEPVGPRPDTDTLESGHDVSPTSTGESLRQ